MKGNLLMAHRAGLPSSGTVQGVITIIQEDRFRIEDGLGRGYLFTLGRRAGASVRELHAWNEQRAVVTVIYEGPPDLGAIAVSVRAGSANGRLWVRREQPGD